MRLKRGWTKKRIVEEFLAGLSVAMIVWRVWRQVPQTPAGSVGADHIEAVLRAALRERTR